MLELGNYVIGICRDFRVEPWAKDPTKFNRVLIIARPYSDQYGNEQTDVTRIDINQEDVQSIQSQVAALREKPVVCPIVYSARTGGKNGAWLSARLPREAKLQLLDSVVKQAVPQK